MQDSLWVKWVHGVYTKGGRWDLFNAPATASWVIKKLCKVKETLEDWMKAPTYYIAAVYKDLLGCHVESCHHPENSVYYMVGVPRQTEN